jgi:dCTP deaminase
MLSDNDIRAEVAWGHLGFDPQPEPSQFQPASVDLRLGHKTRVPGEPAGSMQDGDILWLDPGQFILGHTLERVRLPNQLAAQVGGKSTLARKGLAIHVTAGFIDPGFEGHITLEIVNLSQDVFPLTPKMLIAQLIFFRMDSIPSAPYGSEKYGSHYQGQEGVTPAWW